MGDRMSLESIQAKRKQDPPRLGIYGPPGVGKTLLATSAPGAILIPAEQGARRIDAPQFPQPQNWQDILDAIERLRTGKHDYKMVAIDTLDAAEPLCWAHVCKEAGKADIEAFGYGKGFTAATAAWRDLLSVLERLQDDRGFGICLVAHSQVKQFRNPTGDDYDRYMMRLHTQAAGLISDWVEVLGFVTHDDAVSKNDQGKTVGLSTGRRVLKLQHSAGYTAKTRFDLPDEIVLPKANPWAPFGAELELAMLDKAQIRERFGKIATEAKNAKALDWLASPKGQAADESSLRAALRALRGPIVV